MFLRHLQGATLAALVVSSVVCAATIDVPPAAYQLGLAYHSNSGTTITSSPNVPGSYSILGASGILDPSPITLEAHVTSGESEQTSSVVDLWYNFVLTGPGGVDVPVLFDVSLLANSGQTSQYSLNTAQASIRVTTPVEQRSIEVHCGTAFQYSDCANKQFSQTISVKSQAGGYIGDINLHADATSSGGGYANAFADPYIRVDPAFANAALYTITLSPGIGNDAAPVPGGGEVPEPSTVAMLVSGIGFLVYRRQRAV